MHDADAENFGRRFWRSDAAVSESLEALSSTSIDDQTFRLLADNIPTLCWVANGDGYIVWYNRRWHDYCGTTPEQMEGWGWTAVHSPERLPAVMERWSAAVTSGQPFEMTFPLRGADGVFRPFLTRVQPVRDAGGNVARWFGVNTEISDQVAAERALGAERDLSRSVIEGMGESFALLDREFLVLALNAEAMRLETRSREEIIGRTHWDAYPGSEQSEIGLLYKRAMAEGEPVALEHRYEWEDGRVAWLDMRAYPVGPGLAVFYRDVSERKTAQEVLARSRDELERLVEERTAERDCWWRNSQDFLVVFDANGVFRAISPAVTRTLGWTEAEMIGRTVSDFVVPVDVQSTDGALASAAQEALSSYENRYRCKDGGSVWVSWVAAPEGDLIYASGRDVTREKEAAAELAQTQEQLRQAQKMEAVGQLTGGIAHDFNNMLAVVIGSLDLLGRRLSLDDPRARRYVDAATDGARRAALLTQRLLAFSRQQPLRPEAVDANKLVAGMSDLLRHSIGSAIQLETVLAGGLWRTQADPNQLENVLLNLAVNARDAMLEGGRLTIETQNAHLDARYVASEIGVPAGQYVLIAVSDTGSGMPAEVIAKAFDPFFTTKEVGKGTGLGLSQVYGFVKQTGGHVKIYSESGQGTTVKVYLPRLFGGPDELPEDNNSMELALGDRREVVLVVEDEAAVRQFSVDALGELGYRVLEADGAAAALRLIDSHPEIALMFTDVVMPEVNGRKLADAARARRPDLKILFTTGYTRNAVVHNGVLDAGVELIGKPFTVEELATTIRKALDAP